MPEYVSRPVSHRSQRPFVDDAVGDENGPVIKFVTPRTKRLSEITAADVPPGLDPEDVAIDVPHDSED